MVAPETDRRTDRRTELLRPLSNSGPFGALARSQRLLSRSPSAARATNQFGTFKLRRHVQKVARNDAKRAKVSIQRAASGVSGGGGGGIAGDG